MGPGAALRGVRVRRLDRRRGRPAAPDPRQRGRLAGADGRPRGRGPLEARGVVPAGVRLPRPRRPPALPRAADRDDGRARAAVRQLGPGRHRGRAPLRGPGALDRRPDAGGLGLRRRPTSTPRCPTTTGAARASAATGRPSTSPRWAATTSTTSSTTCTTWPTWPTAITIGSYDAYADEYADRHQRDARRRVGQHHPLRRAASARRRGSWRSAAGPGATRSSWSRSG